MKDDYEALEGEYNRLTINTSVNEELTCLAVISYLVTCLDNASQVVEKSKEVLLAVNRTLINRDSWPQDEEWQSLLPNWFVRSCKPEMTSQEVQEYFEWWYSLSYEEKLEQEKLPQTWSLSNWISYFDPEQREWYWWSAKIIDSNHFVVSVEIRQWPFPSGSLYWLLQVSGASKIEEIKERN